MAKLISSADWLSPLSRVFSSASDAPGTIREASPTFSLSRDDLVECTALIDSVNRGELDRVIITAKPLDVLAQQIVAEVSAREWKENDLFDLLRRAWPYRTLLVETLDRLVQMLSEGFSSRRGALIHYDAINGILRARRGSRLTALASGGTIPDTADYQVLLEPEAQVIRYRGRISPSRAWRATSSSLATLPTASCVLNAGWFAWRMRMVRRRRSRSGLARRPGAVMSSLTRY